MWIGDNILEIPNEQISELLAGLSHMVFVIQIISVVIGLLICFLGLKLLRVLSAVSGLAVGAGIGTAVVFGLRFSGTMIPAGILICAIVAAILCGGIRRMGAFFMVLVNTAGIAASLLFPRTMILLGVCAALALVMAILAAIWTEPVTVVVTGIAGGLSAGIAAAGLTGMNENMWIGYGIGAALALIGIWTQFMIQSRKIGKREEVYSRQMKEQVSRESEVEKARRILAEDEEESEDSDNEGSEDEDDEDDITIISEEL